MSRGTVILVALGALIVAAGIFFARQQHSLSLSQAEAAARVGCRQVRDAFGRHESGLWLTVRGRVQRILPDTDGRATHQRFVLACGSITVLIVNNVTVGSRAPVVPGEVVAAHGQYIWNRLGGLIHYTHAGSGAGGWILADHHVYAALLSPRRG